MCGRVGNDRWTFGVKCEKIQSHTLRQKSAAFRADHYNHPTLSSTILLQWLNLSWGKMTKAPRKSLIQQAWRICTQFFWTSRNYLVMVQRASANTILRCRSCMYYTMYFTKSSLPNKEKSFSKVWVTRRLAAIASLDHKHHISQTFSSPWVVALRQGCTDNIESKCNLWCQIELLI